VVATSAPLLQRWFASTGHPSAKDPYFLYAASNIGSFGALFLYPLLIERLIGVGGQKWVWAIGYGLLVVMIYLCGQVVLKSPDKPDEAPSKPTPPPETNGEAAASADQPAEAAASDEASAEADAIDRGTLSDAPITNWQRLRWIGLAFVPSSLMLGVTTYITTDIASMPLLWVIPLALYLGTFIIAFGKVPEEFQYWLSFITPALLLAMTLITASQWKPSSYNLTLGLHLLTFTAVALSLHGELARTRPATSKLTEFFLLISVGRRAGWTVQRHDRTVGVQLHRRIPDRDYPGLRLPALV
jgi:fumarate reductase subunit C